MAITTTPRHGLPQYGANSDFWPGREGFNEIFRDLDDAIPLSSTWSAQTVALKNAGGVDVTLGNGTATAKKARVGDLIVVHGMVTIGSTTNLGTVGGALYLSLPGLTSSAAGALLAFDFAIMSTAAPTGCALGRGMFDPLGSGAGNLLGRQTRLYTADTGSGNNELLTNSTLSIGGSLTNGHRIVFNLELPA